MQAHFHHIAEALSYFNKDEQRPAPELVRTFQNGIKSALKKDEALKDGSIAFQIRENAKESAQAIENYLNSEADRFYQEFLQLHQKEGAPNKDNILVYYDLYLKMARRITEPLFNELNQNSEEYKNVDLALRNSICGSLIAEVLRIATNIEVAAQTTSNNPLPQGYGSKFAVFASIHKVANEPIKNPFNYDGEKIPTKDLQDLLQMDSQTLLMYVVDTSFSHPSYSITSNPLEKLGIKPPNVDIENLEKNYANLGKKKHLKDIAKLKKAFLKTKSEKERFNMVYTELLKIANDLNLKNSGKPTLDALVEHLNNHPDSFHYARLLAFTLKKYYEINPSILTKLTKTNTFKGIEYPLDLKESLSQLNLPPSNNPKQNKIYADLIPSIISNEKGKDLASFNLNKATHFPHLFNNSSQTSSSNFEIGLYNLYNQPSKGWKLEEIEVDPEVKKNMEKDFKTDPKQDTDTFVKKYIIEKTEIIQGSLLQHGLSLSDKKERLKESFITKMDAILSPSFAKQFKELENLPATHKLINGISLIEKEIRQITNKGKTGTLFSNKQNNISPEDHDRLIVLSNFLKLTNGALNIKSKYLDPKSNLNKLLKKIETQHDKKSILPNFRRK